MTEPDDPPAGRGPRLFEGANVAHIATLLPDGAPHSLPLWAGLEGERIAVLMSQRTRKARKVARDRGPRLPAAKPIPPHRHIIVTPRAGWQPG